MTIALLSLLLGCSTPVVTTPVVVSVNYLPDGESCEAVNIHGKWDGIHPNLDGGIHSVAKKLVEKCCTSRGGEHIGWTKPADNEYKRQFVVTCLYR